VRILWPPKDGEGGHRHEDHQETPVVDGASTWIATGPFGRQRGADSCNGAHESCGHRHCHDAVRGRSSGRRMSPPRFSGSPSATTGCLRRTGRNGVAMRRRDGRGTTGASGTKRPANATGENVRTAGLGRKGKAARRDKLRKGAASLSAFHWGPRKDLPARRTVGDQSFRHPPGVDRRGAPRRALTLQPSALSTDFRSPAAPPSRERREPGRTWVVRVVERHEYFGLDCWR